MNESPGVAEGRHFAGTTTRMLVEFLRDHTPAGTLEQVLSEADESRSVTVLCDDTTWSAYDQVRRLFEAAGRALGGPHQLERVGRETPIVAVSAAEYTDALQTLGSPRELYSNLSFMEGDLIPIVVVEAEECAPGEWVVRSRFRSGFDPFVEQCGFAAGLLSMPPRLYGCPAADVVEETCQCDGASWCSFRVRWREPHADARRADYFATRAQLLEARLEELQGTVAELVASTEPGAVLDRVVASASRAVRAPVFVLALARRPVQGRTIWSSGLDEATAEKIAAEVLADGRADDTSCLVVDVASNRCHYGRLAALDPTGTGFLPQQEVALRAYGRLAAAALDAAEALEDARREAATSRALLELSAGLAELGSVDEVAARLARAVPAVIDCDRAVVVLCDAEAGRGRVAATFGYPDAVERVLRRVVIEVPGAAEPAPKFIATDTGTDDPLVGALLQQQTGSAGAVTVAIVNHGVTLGWVVAVVTSRLERLTEDTAIPDRLRAVAGQAATAVWNAQLLEEVRHQALHDALTGLPNRALILDRVDHILSRARRQHVSAAALFIDLDNFKNINDSLGHDVGDKLLQAVAARLRTALRDSDTIGRLGGDEFVVLVEGSALDAGPELVAERLLDLVREPFHVDAHGASPLTITASVGIATGDRASPGELLRDADVALYAAKAAGKNRYVLFQPEMHTAVRDRLDLEMDLRAALERGELFVVYQPVFNLADGTITGAEALLRWRHPTKGVLHPEAFLAILEESGLIIEVGAWVLDEACRQTAAWQEQDHRIEISVNVAARQLESEQFLTHVRDALTRSGLAPSSLMIEITETAIMRDAAATARHLQAVKALGVRIAIDDFGTGYCSLAYLQQFPVDALKIDQSFTAAIADSPESGALVHMLVHLGKMLGLETVAEGIEDHTQYARLRLEQCDSGQGFLLSQPLEPHAYEALLGDSLRGETAPLPQLETAAGHRSTPTR